jgi:cell division protein FtsB
MNYNIERGSGKRKKYKRIITVIAVVIIAAAAGLYVLGATLGSSSEARVAVSEAIEENTRLRSEMAQKDAEIDELTQQVEELKKKLDAVPTAAPTPYMPEEAAQSVENVQEVQSPRG